MKRNADLSYLDTSNLSFVRRHRADEALPCDVDHVAAVSVAIGEAVRAESASEMGLIPTRGFVSFEVR
jgi:hypothetical protein